MSNKLTVEEAKRILDSYLRRHYKIGIDDVEITNTPGYWKAKEPCKFDSPFNGQLFRTYYFTEHGKRDSKGRFVSPYRVWRTLRMAIWDLWEE